MADKTLLILERSGENLNYTKDNGSIILSGVFTEIGVKNKNNRIYEEAEVLPHINELQEKIKTHSLLGELDHPKEFDISLSNVSHVIESLEYNKETKQVIGKIRLLNTAKGKDAQALVEDGIPLHISSRAAGTVDPQNGKVKIKKMFTYDLVADPGFANAELKRVNESYGFDNDDSLYIYDISENVTEKNITNENMNNEFVKSEDFQKYTEYVNGVLEQFKKKAESVNEGADNEKVEKLVKYAETIAEQVNKIENYSNYLAEKLDKTISYTNYLAENSNSIVAYADYLAEELNNTNAADEGVKEHVENLVKYANYLAENVDNAIKYSNYLGENLDNSIKYSNYLGENLDNSIKYSNYLGENVNNAIKYAEYLKEHVENGIKYSEYIKENVEAMDVNSELVEKVNKLQKYAEYLGENLDTSIQFSDYIKEHVEALEEGKVNENNNIQATSVDDKIAKLIAVAESNANGGFTFMNLLSKDKKEQFKTLDAGKQARIIESMNKGLITSTAQADAIYEAAIAPTQQPKTFEETIPEKYKERWNALNDQRKLQIIAESKFYPMNTQYQINNFWATRDLRSYAVNPVYQQQNTAVNENNNNDVDNNKAGTVTEEFKQALINRVRMNMGN